MHAYSPEAGQVNMHCGTAIVFMVIQTIAVK